MQAAAVRTLLRRIKKMSGKLPILKKKERENEDSMTMLGHLWLRKMDRVSIQQQMHLFGTACTVDSLAKPTGLNAVGAATTIL
jgi:hypothetical protein